MNFPDVEDIPVNMSQSIEVDDEKGAPSMAKCFSIVQTKKFWAPLLAPTCRLCPSMDLVILGMQTPTDPNSTASLWLHRTVSWQRLSTLTNFDGDEEERVTHVAWSPDGRKFALALPSGNVVLYHVEAMVSSVPSMSGGDASSQGLLCVVPVAKEGILGLTWAVGRSHPSWNLTDAEIEEEISWNYRTKYLDRSASLLPPSEHQQNHNPDHNQSEGNNLHAALPTCKTPLSLLCVSTKGKGLHVYLHGRYRIMTLPMMAQRNVDVVCSSDLSHLLVHQEKSMNLSLFSIPHMYQHRYHLQTISSLYCSISSHLEALQKHAPEILASWKVSIKPLDTKLEALVRLLKDYGVQRDMRSVLVQYVLVGHTSVSSDLSNAIDQFFTGVQMNDQLVQRMERSLQAAIANVETTARSYLLGPARALAFHAGELLGLARFANNLLSPEAAQILHDSCAILLTTVEYTLTQIVEARFRLRDFVSWLRSTGSEVKARGTAPNSAQRENAKKRRVPQATVERVLRYLQTETYQSSSITETLLGIPLTELLLHDGTEFVHSRPSSPTTVARNNLSAPSFERKTPTVHHATKGAVTAIANVFEYPRTYMSRSVYRLDLFLPVERKTEFLPVAIHSRVGKDCSKQEYDYFGEDKVEDEGYFSPSVIEGKALPDIPHYNCRQWSVIAKTNSPTESIENYVVKLYLIPHGWSESADCPEDDILAFGLEPDDTVQECGVPFYLTTEIFLPVDHRVLDMGFYGDDGNSKLFSGLDDKTSGRERRQALGLLLGCKNTEVDSTEDAIELWLMPYDNIQFQVVPTKKDSKQIFLDDGDISSECQVQAKARTSLEEDEEEDGVVFAKTRAVGSLDASSSPHTISSRLMLSGSRGIGGVFTSSQGVTTLGLLDMEEDEEDDESEEELDDGESMDA